MSEWLRLAASLLAILAIALVEKDDKSYSIVALALAVSCLGVADGLA